MNKLILLFLISLFSTAIYAQVTSSVYIAEIGKDQHSAKLMTMGDYIYQYNNYFTSTGFYNAVVRKFDANFDLIDTIIISNENSNVLISDLINYQDENIVVIGSKEDINNNGFYEIMILKLDEYFNSVVEEYYNMNTGLMDFTYHFVRENGNIVIASSINGNPPGFQISFFDFLIMELNVNSQMIFDSIYNYSPSEIVMDLKPISGTENCLLLCYPNFESGNMGHDLNKLDENFELLEANYIPENGFQMSVELLNNDNIIINSRKVDQSYTPSAWLAQQRLIDENFNEIAINVFGSSDTMMYPAQYNSIAYQDETNIYTAYTYNIDATSYSLKESFVCLSSIDDELNQNWTKYYGGDAYYFVCDICPASDNGCLITGTRYKNGSSGPFEREIFIMKVDENGLITSSNEEETIPTKNAIISPNPGKNYLQLHTGIYPAKLQIFNINGQLILEEQIHQNTTTIHSQSLSSGTYIWSLIKEGQVIENGKWVKE